MTAVPYIDQSAAKAFVEWMVTAQNQCFPSLIAPEGMAYS